MTQKKTYKVTNVRKSYRGDTTGTVRQDTLQSVLQNYPDAVTVFKTGFHPPRFEINHYPEYEQLQKIKKNTVQPGEEIRTSYLADELLNWDYRCSVNLSDSDESGIQKVSVRGTMRSYQVHVDTNVVEWGQ